MTLRAKTKTLRESNSELLSIVLMLMIIGYHFIVHGAGVAGGLKNYTMADTTSTGYILLKSFLVIAVNCFVFISGFYRIKFRMKTVVSLLLQVLFYSLAFTFIADLAGLRPLNLSNYFRALIPLFSGMWWFITAYIALYLLSPLLNAAIDSLKQKMLLLVVVNLSIINMGFGFLFSGAPVGAREGFSLISFINIYLLAQYIKLYVDIALLERHARAVYLANSLLIFMLALISLYIGSEAGIDKAFNYNNPLVLLSAVAFFFCFKQLRLQSNFINAISPYVLGVYLFHDHPLMRTWLIDTFYALSSSSCWMLHFVKLFSFTLMCFLWGL